MTATTSTPAHDLRKGALRGRLRFAVTGGYESDDVVQSINADKLSEGMALWREAARGNDRLTFGGGAFISVMLGLAAIRMARRTV